MKNAMKKLLTLMVFVLAACTNSNKESQNSGEVIDFKSKNTVVQSSQMIVLEKFTADWCAPCKGVAEKYDALFTNEGLGDNAIMLTYQFSDHFYNSFDSDTKAFFDGDTENNHKYDYNPVPMVFKNGQIGETIDNRMKGKPCPYTDEPTLKNILGSSKEDYVAPIADYIIQMNFKNNILEVKITNQSNTNHENLKLHAMITEDGHAYDVAPGTNEQTKFSHAIVKYLGVTNVEATSPGTEQTITFDFDSIQLPIIKWNSGLKSRSIANINVVIFIQNPDTKTILQGAELSLESE